MNSCSFSVVHSNLHVPEREFPVVTESRPRTATFSMASMIWESFWGLDCVLRPRSWSEMRWRRRFLDERRDDDDDWSVSDERVRIRFRREVENGEAAGTGKRVAMGWEEDEVNNVTVTGYFLFPFFYYSLVSFS